MADIIRKEDLLPRTIAAPALDDGGFDSIVRLMEQADTTLDKVNKIMNSPVGMAIAQKLGLNVGPKLQPAKPQESARIAAEMERRLNAAKP